MDKKKATNCNVNYKFPQINVKNFNLNIRYFLNWIIQARIFMFVVSITIFKEGAYSSPAEILMSKLKIYRLVWIVRVMITSHPKLHHKLQNEGNWMGNTRKDIHWMNKRSVMRRITNKMRSSWKMVNLLLITFLLISSPYFREHISISCSGLTFINLTRITR